MTIETKVDLHQLYSTKKEFVNLMIKQGKLNHYPLDLSNKESQLFFKKLVSLLVEESFEAYNAHEKYSKLLEGFSFEDLEFPQYLEEAHEELLEEIADVLHIYVELFIYLVPEYMLSELVGDMFRMMGFENVHRNSRDLNSMISKSSQNPEYFSWISSTGIINFRPLEVTGNRLHTNLFEKAYKDLMYGGVLKSLHTATNGLKMRDWRDEAEIPETFGEEIMKGFISFLQFCASMNLTGQVLANEFLKKHRINMERRKNRG